MKYHHIGIPTTETKSNEIYIEKFKMFVSGYGDSPHGVEWMRFEEGCPLPDIVKTIPHVAFEVDNLAVAISDKEVIIEPNFPSDGVMVAFILENGAPIEYLQIERTEGSENEACR